MRCLKGTDPKEASFSLREKRAASLLEDAAETADEHMYRSWVIIAFIITGGVVPLCFVAIAKALAAQPPEATFPFAPMAENRSLPVLF
jgi:polyferredoxin